MTCSLRPFATALVLTAITPALAHARREPPQDGASAPLPVAPSSVEAVAAPPVAAPPESASAVVPAPASAPAPASVPAPAVSSVPPPRPVAPSVDPRAGRDLMLAGLGTFATFYLFTSLGGAFVIDKARKTQVDPYTGVRGGANTQRVRYGKSLLVPVVGPFLALGTTNSARERWGAALSGTAQIAGAVLFAAGVAQRVGARRRAQRYAFGAGMASGGATVSLAGRF